MYRRNCVHMGKDEYHQLHCFLKDCDPEYVKVCRDRKFRGEEEE